MQSTRNGAMARYLPLVVVLLRPVCSAAVLAAKPIAGTVADKNPGRIWIAVSATVAFALLARLMRGVTHGGAAAGAAICFLLYLGAGPAGLIALISVFALTWCSTRYGQMRKKELGIAEKQGGRRARQVLANLSVAAMCSVLHFIDPGRTVLLLAMCAALSEAAADTVSSEIGKAGAQGAHLITNWQRVPAGTDGGVTPIGTLAGFCAAMLVSLACVLTGLVPGKWFGVAVTAAAAGMVADSYMGATLEQRHWLNNDGVNFLSTCVAALLGWLLL